MESNDKHTPTKLTKWWGYDVVTTNDARQYVRIDDWLVDNETISSMLSTIDDCEELICIFSDFDVDLKEDADALFNMLQTSTAESVFTQSGLMVVYSNGTFVHPAILFMYMMYYNDEFRAAVEVKASQDRITFKEFGIVNGRVYEEYDD